MSQIKLSSNASGTGIFTLESPATNTNRTLTLPDASGTFLTNSGTEDGSFSTLSVNSSNISAENSLGFRNRIINGDMRIDQRNAGASVAFTNGYTLDRWFGFEDTDGAMTAQRSTTAPNGFANSLICTTTTADSSLSATQRVLVEQRIEGFNVADLGWGTVNAKTITLSFWVRSSLTGTFGGVVKNGSSNRSYPFTYAISSANTFEYKTVTIAGDTSGTWATDSTVGLVVDFGLGVGSTYSGTAGAWAGSDFNSATGAVSVIGTLNATWYITGVQLEVGSTATPFERRPYGTELMLCQRYYQKSYDQANALGTVTTTGEVRWQAASTGGESAPTIMLPVVMRTAPTLTIYSAATGASGNVRNYSTSADVAMTGANVIGSRGWSGGTTGFTAGNIIGYQFAATSEL